MSNVLQNSVVERKNHHILNVARALFFQSRVPLRFWSYCVLAATYLVNRTPTRLLHDKSPYEILYGKEVGYSCMRVFGCFAFVVTLTSHRTKFQPRARTCFFGLSVECLKCSFYHLVLNVFFLFLVIIISGLRF